MSATNLSCIQVTCTMCALLLVLLQLRARQAAMEESTLPRERAKRRRTLSCTCERGPFPTHSVCVRTNRLRSLLYKNFLTTALLLQPYPIMATTISTSLGGPRRSTPWPPGAHHGRLTFYHHSSSSPCYCLSSPPLFTEFPSWSRPPFFLSSDSLFPCIMGEVEASIVA